MTDLRILFPQLAVLFPQLAVLSQVIVSCLLILKFCCTRANETDRYGSTFYFLILSVS